jgi:hypothetical protein
MIRRYAQVTSLSSNLHNLLNRSGRNLSVPDKKSLRDDLTGLLRARWAIVSQMARQLPNQRTRFLSRLDRLEYHLGKDSDLEYKLKDALPEMWLHSCKRIHLPSSTRQTLPSRGQR